MSRCARLILIFVLASLGACANHIAGPAPASPTPSPAAALPDAALFIKRMATQDGSQDSTAEMRLVVEREDGHRDQLDFRLQRKYTPEQTATLLTVTAPREESEKALLAFERPDQATDALSYLAGLKRLTHLNSSSLLDFRGAKVSVQELLGLELNQYHHTPAERADGGEAGLVKIEFTEKFDRHLAFPRLTGFFRESDQTPARFELYNSRGQLAKTIQIAEVKELQGHHTITRVVIEDPSKNLKMTLDTLRMKYDQGLPDAIFTEGHLIKSVTEASRKLIQS